MKTAQLGRWTIAGKDDVFSDLSWSFRGEVTWHNQFLAGCHQIFDLVLDVGNTLWLWRQIPVEFDADISSVTVKLEEKPEVALG